MMMHLKDDTQLFAAPGRRKSRGREIVGRQYFKTLAGNQSAIKRSF
jgi:hypothetical protein